MANYTVFNRSWTVSGEGVSSPRSVGACGTSKADLLSSERAAEVSTVHAKAAEKRVTDPSAVEFCCVENFIRFKAQASVTHAGEMKFKFGTYGAGKSRRIVRERRTSADPYFKSHGRRELRDSNAGQRENSLVRACVKGVCPELVRHQREKAWRVEFVSPKGGAR